MLWKSIVLTAQEIASGDETEIQSEFNLIWSDNGFPPGATLYTNRKYRPGEFCVFLTPKAAAIVGNFLGGHELADCLAPNLEDVAVLAGDAGTPGHD